MKLSDLAYDSAIRTLRIASPAFSIGDSKLARGMRGRRGAAARLIAWARESRDPTRPLIWFHAPSVGEGLAQCVFGERVSAFDEEFFSAERFRGGRGGDPSAFGL